MEALVIADEINHKIQELEALKKTLPDLSEKKAIAEADYEKSVAVMIARLINGAELELEGRTIKNPPNAMLDKLAKGLCWENKYVLEIADSAYRNALKITDMTQAQLNGFQSINRHLSET